MDTETLSKHDENKTNRSLDELNDATKCNESLEELLASEDGTNMS